MTFRQLREAAGLSQGQLAAKIGVRQAAISQLELGHSPNPRYDTMVRLAAALGTSLENLHLAIRASVQTNGRKQR